MGKKKIAPSDKRITISVFEYRCISDWRQSGDISVYGSTKPIHTFRADTPCPDFKTALHIALTVAKNTVIPNTLEQLQELRNDHHPKDARYPYLNHFLVHLENSEGQILEAVQELDFFTGEFIGDYLIKKDTPQEDEEEEEPSEELEEESI